jgi:Putative DNA-binding domain
VFPWNPYQWTEDYLASLIGQPESARLEYKSGKGLSRKEDRDRFVREQLSPTLSAFANSEGGILIIGLDEERHTKPRVAKELDGVVINKGEAIESTEQFQQIVDSCISPFLPGIRIRRVGLSDPLADRSVLVIYVPQGTTAYQAKDYVYYSRSEFETKSMPDHEVRLRMLRGRVAQARVEVVHCTLLTAEAELAKRQKTLRDIEASEDLIIFERGVPSREELEAPQRTFDEYSFRLNVANSGEVTIRDFLLSISFETPFKVFDPESSNPPQDLPWGFEVRSGRELRYRFAQGQRNRGQSPPDNKIFPGDRVLFPNKSWTLHAPHGVSLQIGTSVLHWVIYLDNAPSSSGEINLTDHFRHQQSETQDA